jgi:GT2 family glycosyltransferase
MNICILIPIHNRIEITKKGLNSLYTALGRLYATGARTASFEVIVIDDGSTDGSTEWIQENYKACVVVRGDGNLWWSGAINKGIDYALDKGKVDFIMLWNDDTLCDPDYFVNLVKYLDDPQYANTILASKILWEDQKDTIYNCGCLFDFKTGKTTIVGFNRKDGSDFSKPVRIDWSGGMGTVIPAGILTQVGRFDSKHFPQYHGDKDYFLRAARNGYAAYALPDLRIWNNRLSTGTTLARPFTRSFIKCLFSKRSQYNIGENFTFLKIHTPNPTAFYYFLRYYFIFFVTYIKKLLRLYRLKEAYYRYARSA